MAVIAPPAHLDYSLPLTAIEEEQRMEPLGVRFLCHNRCFHYLVPVERCEEGVRAEAPQARFILFSYLYNPVSKDVSRENRVPLQTDRFWEDEARAIGFYLTNDDRDQNLW